MYLEVPLPAPPPTAVYKRMFVHKCGTSEITALVGSSRKASNFPRLRRSPSVVPEQRNFATLCNQNNASITKYPVDGLVVA